MRLTSMAARFSGTVTYSDNTVGSFHVQAEGPIGAELMWSVDQGDARVNLRQISWFDPPPAGGGWPYWSVIGSALNALPFLTFSWDTILPPVQKTVTDLVARFDLLLTRDDNLIYPVAVIIDGLTVPVRVELPDQATGATNLATLKADLHTLFHTIMDQASVT